ncbi:MAG: PAS domain-containing protein [Minwuia sp.]|nr:PAS domain-containing protein [Minwuia sp.]
MNKAREPEIRDAVSEVWEQLSSDVTRGTLNYWESIRGERIWPLRQDLNPMAIVEFIPNLMILGVERDPLDFVYRLTGTQIDENMAGPLKGLRVSELPHQMGPGEYWELLRSTAERGLPCTRPMPYVGQYRDFKRCELVALPLSTDGCSADQILVTADFMAIIDD